MECLSVVYISIIAALLWLEDDWNLILIDGGKDEIRSGAMGRRR